MPPVGSGGITPTVRDLPLPVTLADRTIAMQRVATTISFPFSAAARTSAWARISYGWRAICGWHDVAWRLIETYDSFMPRDWRWRLWRTARSAFRALIRVAGGDETLASVRCAGACTFTCRCLLQRTSLGGRTYLLPVPSSPHATWPHRALVKRLNGHGVHGFSFAPALYIILHGRRLL